MLDYTLSYTSGSVFIVFKENIVKKRFTATGLTTGTTYKFKVQSRNSFGTSLLYSNEIQILCGSAPNKPNAPTITRTLNNINIGWSDPITNGSPILYYRVFIRSFDLMYYEETTVCDKSVTSNVAA